MKISTVEICSKNLQEYFCEDLKLSDMISLLSEFVKNVEKAKIEIEQRRLREERSAKLNEQQMLRKRTFIGTNRKADFVDKILAAVCYHL